MKIDEAVKVLQEDKAAVEAFLEDKGWVSDGYLAQEDIGEAGVEIFVRVKAPAYQNRAYYWPTVSYKEGFWQFWLDAGEGTGIDALKAAYPAIVKKVAADFKEEKPWRRR